MAGKKKAPVTRVGKDSDTFIPSNILPSLDKDSAFAQGSKSRLIDADFFETGSGLNARPFIQENGKEFSRTKLYPHQIVVTDIGTPIDPRQGLQKRLQNMHTKDKKHKKMKRVKQRSGKGYDN